MVSRTAIASFYLCAILILWRFQVGTGGAGLSLYVLLAPLALAWGCPRFVYIRTFVASAVILLAMAFAISQGVRMGRLAVSLVALGVLAVNWLAVGASVAIAKEDGWATIARIIKVLIRVQVALQLIEIAGLDLLGNRSFPHYFLPIIRAPGLSIEPSHVAITWSPLIFSSLLPRDRCWGGHLGRWDYALVYLALFLCPSASLFLVLALALGLWFAGKRPFVTLFALAVVVSMVQNPQVALGLLPGAVQDRAATLFALLANGYFDRQTNLSSVVFYGGMQAALTSLKDYPLGVGFLNMASLYNLPDFTNYRSVVGSSNVNDGSSILFKMIAEFGYLGLAVAVYAVLALWAFALRRTEDMTVGVLMFPLAAFFARGAGYLDGPVMISLALVIFGIRNFRTHSWPSGSPRPLHGVHA